VPGQWLPRRGRAPFQVINYVVSSTVFQCVGTRTAAEEAENLLSPQIKSGRAFFAVVPKGSVERPWDGLSGGCPGHGPVDTVGHREEVVLFVTEYRMGLDHLGTREEIDASRIAHVGFSGGAIRAAIVLIAIEPRIRSTVSLGGAILPFSDLQILPEANPVNFAPLPEPKRLELVEAGHLPELEIRTPLINNWLDETLGPVD
jgi:hypothetical protein